MYYNVIHLHLYGYKLLNRWDVSRRLNILKRKRKAYYKYQGRRRIWFINQLLIEYIVKKSTRK